jgi:hypothetical protein
MSLTVCREHPTVLAILFLRPASARGYRRQPPHGSFLTRRWRKRDSNFWSHLQKGQLYAELALRFLGPGCTGRDRFDL